MSLLYSCRSLFFNYVYLSYIFFIQKTAYTLSKFYKNINQGILLTNQILGLAVAIQASKHNDILFILRCFFCYIYCKKFGFI